MKEQTYPVEATEQTVPSVQPPLRRAVHPGIAALLIVVTVGAIFIAMYTLSEAPKSKVMPGMKKGFKKGDPMPAAPSSTPGKAAPGTAGNNVKATPPAEQSKAIAPAEQPKVTTPAGQTATTPSAGQSGKKE